MTTKGAGRKSQSDKPPGKLSEIINQRIDYGVKLRAHRAGKHAKAKQPKVKR